MNKSYILASAVTYFFISQGKNYFRSLQVSSSFDWSVMFLLNPQWCTSFLPFLSSQHQDLHNRLILALPFYLALIPSTRFSTCLGFQHYLFSLYNSQCQLFPYTPSLELGFHLVQVSSAHFFLGYNFQCSVFNLTYFQCQGTISNARVHNYTQIQHQVSPLSLIPTLVFHIVPFNLIFTFSLIISHANTTRRKPPSEGCSKGFQCYKIWVNYQKTSTTTSTISNGQISRGSNGYVISLKNYRQSNVFADVFLVHFNHTKHIDA